MRNSNSLSLKNTFYWTIANLNFTQSKYCAMIIEMVKFQRNRICGKFHIRIQFFGHSESLLFVLFTMTGSSITWSTIGWKIRKKLDVMITRPFPSSLVPLFQNESKCETFLMKMSSACSFIFMQIKVIFIRMISHLDSLWNRGTRKLGSGLMWLNCPITVCLLN